jgi:hypothetical protein
MLAQFAELRRHEPAFFQRSVRAIGNHRPAPQHQHHVTLLREVLPIRSPDPAVIAKAQELGAILVSLNGDFSDIVAYPPSAYGGIIAIQLHNHPEVIPSLMQRLPGFCSTNPEPEFYRGKLFLVAPHRIRIREQGIDFASQARPRVAAFGSRWPVSQTGRGAHAPRRPCTTPSRSTRVRTPNHDAKLLARPAHG